MINNLKKIALIFVLLNAAALSYSKTIVIGSKSFSEGRLLGEILTKKLEDKGFNVTHKKGMGSTLILWQALSQGYIDLYIEYTGTIAEHILKSRSFMHLPEIKEQLNKRYRINTTDSLGFNNSYGLVMNQQTAKKLSITSISDLAIYDHLSYGFTHEFLARKDGWPKLKNFYGLAHKKHKGVDHNLGYQLLAQKKIDVKDSYSTDGRLKNSSFVMLKDNLNFFPEYKPVILYKDTLEPKAAFILESMAGTINQNTIIDLNQRSSQIKDERQVALRYLNSEIIPEEGLFIEVLSLCYRHLYLVIIALMLSLIIGLPLGIAASQPSLKSKVIIGSVDMLQTIPSLALIALLVPIFGITTYTAIWALFLYGLLPIVRNTAVGLQSIPSNIRDSAQSLGLTSTAQFRLIFLPFAFPMILTGIKTSFIINIGTATLAALIGAGGLGEPILTGLSLNDYSIVLKGALPAAFIAILSQGLFYLVDKVLISPGLRH